MEEKALIDYTKYRLKPEKEILDILNGTQGVSLIICEKCYKNFDEDSEPECEEMHKILEKAGITPADCVSVPLLCNNNLTKEVTDRLKKAGSNDVGVVSCGIGIQFIASQMDDRRVYALADSISHSGNSTSIAGYHGISLGEEKCSACGQCYLDITGGICPVVNCAKSLLNGACGGANEEGKCEVNSDTPCVWIQIYERLREQEQEFSDDAHIRNYDVFNPADKKREIEENRRKRAEGFTGGIYPAENKEQTQDLPITDFPAPARVVLFMSQHTGIPAKEVVKPGDTVKMGQKIGESGGFISLPVHSSVSGKVIAVEDRMHPSLLVKSPAVVIENDFKDTICASVKAIHGWNSLGKEAIIDIIRDKGISGLGGAMFPTGVKLSPPKCVDTLVVNGCECEPFLSADNRLMVEKASEICKGIEIAAEMLCVGNVVVGIEDNKPAAISSMKSFAAKSALNIRVESLNAKYPQGAEKMLIKRALGREVPEGGLPFDAGCVVLNVGTLYAIYNALYAGMPLIERVVTVAGESLKSKGNFIMRIGTPVEDVVDFCFDGDKPSINREYILKMGGPMMGTVQKDTSSSVVKGTSGFVFMKKFPVDASEERDCIKCGRCADVCPMGLYPLYYAYYGKRAMWNRFFDYNVKNCIECGACQYICSSKIDLVGLIKKAKKNADNKT